MAALGWAGIGAAAGAAYGLYSGNGMISGAAQGAMLGAGAYGSLRYGSTFARALSGGSGMRGAARATGLRAMGDINRASIWGAKQWQGAGYSGASLLGNQGFGKIFSFLKR